MATVVRGSISASVRLKALPGRRCPRPTDERTRVLLPTRNSSSRGCMGSRAGRNLPRTSTRSHARPRPSRGSNRRLRPSSPATWRCSGSSSVQTLLDYGANINGLPGGWNPLLAALHNGRREAAEFLAARGARLDLEGAAGVGRLDVVQTFFNEDGTLRNATNAQMESGFGWACE